MNFIKLLQVLSSQPEDLQVWSDSAVQLIQQAQSSMKDFIEEDGDGEGFGNSVGAYWTLEMGDDLAKHGPLMSGKFWQFVAFEQLLCCEDETLIVWADDAETIWAEIVDLFEDSADLELDSDVFEMGFEEYIGMMQNKLDLYSGDSSSYRMLSLIPPLPDGANIYVALVKNNDVKQAIELFAYFGVKAHDAAEGAFW